MAFNLVLTKRAEKALDNLPGEYRTRVILALREIREEPYEGKKLSGKRAGQYSIRVGIYRIIYSIEKRELIIVVIDVDDRKDVYRS